MTQSSTPPSVQDVALIVGGGPGISSSCARLFTQSGMRVGIAARNPDKPALQNLEKTHGVRRYACDASEPAAVELLFQNVVRDLGAPTLLVHNIDGRVPGIFGKGITEADPSMALATLRNSAFSAFLVAQQAARLMRENKLNANGANLSSFGLASVSNDSFTLVGTGMPNSSCLYFQGTTQMAAGMGAAFGDGLRCAGGTVVRLGTKTNVASASQYPAGGDASISVKGMVGAPGTRTYQVWYRNAAAFCTPSTFNLTNGLEVTWY